MEHKTFYMDYWWSYLDELALAEQFDAGDILLEPTTEKWIDSSKVVGIGEDFVFPAQHFIWEPVNLDKRGGAGKMVPLYEYLGSDGIRLNLEYITTWKKWRARQVSSDNLLPADNLKLLFTDPHGAIVDEANLKKMEEAEGLAFLNEQVELFEKHMGWSPIA